MVLEPIPQSLPVHFFGSRPQPPTSPRGDLQAPKTNWTGFCPDLKKGSENRSSHPRSLWFQLGGVQVHPKIAWVISPCVAPSWQDSSLPLIFVDYCQPQKRHTIWIWLNLLRAFALRSFCTPTAILCEGIWILEVGLLPHPLLKNTTPPIGRFSAPTPSPIGRFCTGFWFLVFG